MSPTQHETGVEHVASSLDYQLLGKLTTRGMQRCRAAFSAFMKRVLPRALLLLLSLFTFGCDHLSKGAASSLLSKGQVFQVVDGLFELRYTENRGVAFSLLDNVDHALVPVLLGLAALGVTVAVAVHWWRRRQAGLVEQSSYAIIVGGGAANAVDRLVDGSVVDFLHLSGWPIFNLADVALVMGALLLVLAHRVPRLSRIPAPARLSEPPGRGRR